MSLVVPLWIACSVLAAAGSAKLVDPRFTAGALVDLGVPQRLATWSAVRAIGVLEVVLGITALLSGWPVVAGLVAAAYLAFAVVVAAARRADTPLQTCGCFGVPDVAPTRGHLFLNLGLGSIAAATVFVDVPSAGTVIRDDPGPATVLLAMTALGAWLAMAAFKELGTLAGMRTRKAVNA